MQTLFGTLLSESIDDGGVYVQSDRNKQLGKTIIKGLRKLFSSSTVDPNDEVSQSFFDGMESILSVIERMLDEGPVVSDNEIIRTIFEIFNNMMSAVGRNADPNDEMTLSVINGFKTLLPFIMPNGGKSETKQVFMNFLGEIQSNTDDDEFLQTAMNIAKKLISAARRNNPKSNNEFAKAIFNAVDALFSGILKASGNKENQPTDKEITNTVLSHVNNIISAWIKVFENGKIQSPDSASEAKTPQWGTFLDSLGTSLLNKYLGR